MHNFDLNEFQIEVQERKKFIDSCLTGCLEQVDAYPAIIHQAIHYAVFNGGKRLRPMLVMEGAVLAGGDRESVIPTACALEMIHSYSLVHDDLPAMDDDDFRRGKPTCHKVFGEDIAILTGDALLTAAFELIAQNAAFAPIKAERALQVISEVSKAAGSRGMIGGQVIDLQSEGKNIEFSTLQTLHSLKTGALFKAALRSGAILGGMDSTGLEKITSFAHSFGLLFQITDDLLDVRGDAELMGKPIGSDIKNQKTTYPSLFGIERTEEIARRMVDECLSSLEYFGPAANFLRELTWFTLVRNN
ncbi:MAG: polyprenyl synthetase family protein [Syntrophomonadaceae bacterium]|jgi:geranylgeranyl diphosphate synthase type II